MNFWLVVSVAVCALAQAGRERPITHYEDHPAFKNSDGSSRQLDGFIESSKPLNADRTGDRRRLDEFLTYLQSGKPSLDTPFNRRLFMDSSPSADCLSATANLSQDLNNLQPTAANPQLELLTKVWRALPHWFDVCQLWEPLSPDVAQTLLTSNPPEALSTLWPASDVYENIEPSIEECLMSGRILTKASRDVFLHPNTDHVERRQRLHDLIARGLADVKASCDIRG